MPTSTHYEGNKFISRRERQASVVLYNQKAEEINKETVYKQKTLSNVKVDISNENSFTTSGSTGIKSCKLYVELRDGNPGYVGYENWDEMNNRQWTVQPGKDYFIANGQKFVVQLLIEKRNIRGDIDVLEVIGK